MNPSNKSVVRLIEGISDYDDVVRSYESGELDLIFDPIRQMVTPGDRVVLKPNLVKECHLHNANEWEQVLTHPAIIECTLKCVLESLRGKGEVFIVDAPQSDADWVQIMKTTGIETIAETLSSEYEIPVFCIDLREEIWTLKNGIVVSRKKNEGDPLGYASIDLSSSSEFSNKAQKNYYGADYDTSETRRYHNESNNIYVFSRLVLSANVFINLPKMKTHKLAGLTGALKNIVGACIVKNSLPHHTIGTPEEGGDQYAEKSSLSKTEGKMKALANKLLSSKNPLIGYPIAFMKNIAKKSLGDSSEVVRNGSWHGNDTIWRAILDLNKILLYADQNGRMQEDVQRKYYCITDGVIAGQGNGPLAPEAFSAGVIFAGDDPVALDALQALLMGFDYKSIPAISNAFNISKYYLCNGEYKDIEILEAIDSEPIHINELDESKTFKFKPHFGWRNNIENATCSDSDHMNR